MGISGSIWSPRPRAQSSSPILEKSQDRCSKTLPLSKAGVFAARVSSHRFDSEVSTCAYFTGNIVIPIEPPHPIWAKIADSGASNT